MANHERASVGTDVLAITIVIGSTGKIGDTGGPNRLMDDYYPLERHNWPHLDSQSTS